MDKIFMVGGGGSGAKVAEALVHLCAAGLGPVELHLLLIDADTTNGNISRALATVEAHNRIQPWPWATRLRQGGPGLTLFRTKIHAYTLTEKIQSVANAGLDGAAAGDPDLKPVLSLLFDEHERTDRCEGGFHAQPNFGCLVLAQHLNQHLQKTPDAASKSGSHGSAADFVTALIAATVEQTVVPVVAVASVFGGTGASLLPVINDCVRMAFDSRVNKNFHKLTWSKVMLLPFFLPREKIGSVDPDRYHLDASSALQYYSKTYGHIDQDGQAPDHDPIYLVGAKNPGSNKVAPELEGSEQKNPPFVEELIAALAVLHAANGKASSDRPVHVFNPGIEAGLGLHHLPLAHTVDGPAGAQDGRLDRQLSALCHLGAFLLRAGDHKQGACLTGLLRYWNDKEKDAADLAKIGWFDQVLGGWSAGLNNSDLANARAKGDRDRFLREDRGAQSHKAAERPLAEYSSRLLLWASQALRDSGPAAILELTHGHYVNLHNTMCDVTAGQINLPAAGKSQYEADADNALVRICRAALAAMLLEEDQAGGHEDKKLRFTLHSPQAGRTVLKLMVAQNELRPALDESGLFLPEELNRLFAAYDSNGE